MFKEIREIAHLIIEARRLSHQQHVSLFTLLREALAHGIEHEYLVAYEVEVFEEMEKDSLWLDREHNRPFGSSLPY